MRILGLLGCSSWQIIGLAVEKHMPPGGEKSAACICRTVPYPCLILTAIDLSDRSSVRRRYSRQVTWRNPYFIKVLGSPWQHTNNLLIARLEAT